MKKVLIISYHYPPDLAVGAIRPAKFAKNLPHFNIEPIILTVKEKYYEKLDKPEIANNQVSYEIYMTIRFPNFRDIYMFVKTILKKKNSPTQQKNGTPQKRDFNGDIIYELPETTIEKLKRYFNSIIVWLPDDKTGWILPAVLKGLQLFRNKNIDAIYTTGPPHSVHLIGLLLKILTKKNWVADFRDPWIGAQKPSFVKSIMSDAIENWLEKQVVSKCDHVVSVTPEMTEMFQNRYPNIKKEKFKTIYNGYDSEELEQYKKLKKYDKITFTYAGSFYLGRDPEFFLNALRNLIDEGQVQSDKIQVRFIGNCRYLYDKSIEDIVEQIGLSNIVNFVDHIPRNEVLAEMAKSHILLLLAPDQPLQIPGKIYEYMGLDSYILAICGNGATANILEQYEKAYTVHPDDKKKLSESLSMIFSLAENENSRNSRPLVVNSEQKKFLERSHLTQKLTVLL